MPETEALAAQAGFPPLPSHCGPRRMPAPASGPQTFSCSRESPTAQESSQEGRGTALRAGCMHRTWTWDGVGVGVSEGKLKSLTLMRFFRLCRDTSQGGSKLSQASCPLPSAGPQPAISSLQKMVPMFPAQLVCGLKLPPACFLSLNYTQHTQAWKPLGNK